MWSSLWPPQTRNPHLVDRYEAPLRLPASVSPRSQIRGSQSAGFVVIAAAVYFKWETRASSAKMAIFLKFMMKK